MKWFTILLFILSPIFMMAQGRVLINRQVVKKVKKNFGGEVKIATNSRTDTTVEKERPLNFFGSVGGTFSTKSLYDMSVSPIDNTVRIENIKGFSNNISLGIVWNPIVRKEFVEKTYITKGRNIETEYEQERKNFAIAALSNVFQVAIANSQASLPASVDFGIGIGYRKDNFLALFTFELPTIRQPRQYMLDAFKDKNVVAKRPDGNLITSFSITDNNVFISKVLPSVGIKLAYTFVEPK